MTESESPKMLTHSGYAIDTNGDLRGWVDNKAAHSITVPDFDEAWLRFAALSLGGTRTNHHSDRIRHSLEFKAIRALGSVRPPDTSKASELGG